MENKKILSNRLATRYLMIIRNEENFAEKTTFTFSYAKIILGVVALFIVLFAISFYLSTSLLKQWFDPRHAEMRNKRELVGLYIKIDSLISEVDKKDRFIDNFKLIMSGKADSYVDTENISGLDKDNEIQISDIETERLSPIDSQFRRQFEQNGLKPQISSDYIATELQEFYLIKPLDKGVLLDNKYNPRESHYGIDIAAKEGEFVMSVADGTVVYAGWTLDHGYVIAIQHRSNLISQYKHNSDILKRVGSFVRTGEVIAIIGNTGELTSGPHLHFELWYNGKAVDPEEFIKF